ncbi:MAG: urea carboxylase, partial [Frankiaceae bacterium]|nr:urea carboxylase [Frankiaceae bacterium]
MTEPREGAAAGRIDVVEPGVQTTVQDLRGRRGFWAVGVPPSGAWDDVSFALANVAVGNAEDAAGLESVMRGPVLRFRAPAVVCVTGAGSPTVDGQPVRCGIAVTVPAGGVLALGGPAGAGMRCYLAVRGGLAAEAALGSPATFLLGGFGGHQGRALVAGDVLEVQSAEDCAAPRAVDHLLPRLSRKWDVRVIAGPHGAPEHLTPEGVVDLFATEWTVDHRSDRTGVRLVGASPGWARPDGGDAGLHPSNVHDSAYPVGAVMLSGDTPVVVGPDGPSLGGFVVPCVVIAADRWVFAQARPGDRVRLCPVTPEHAAEANSARASLLLPVPPQRGYAAPAAASGRPVPLAVLPDLVVRRSGDHHLLAEAGPPVLDLDVRLRVHLLAQALAGTRGVTDAVEGVRSLLLSVDDRVLTLPALAELVAAAWLDLPDPETVVLPVRDVVLPIAFDDPSVHEAMARYQRSVRPDAPWCPDNVEFIRRVNGL